MMKAIGERSLKKKERLAATGQEERNWMQQVNDRKLMEEVAMMELP